MPSHRDFAILKAREIIGSDPLFLDTETTGLSLVTDEVVEIAIVDISGNLVYQSLVQPTCPVSDGARQVHHISDDDLINAPRFSHIQPVLVDLLTGRTLVIYNSSFDVSMLHNSAKSIYCNAMDVIGAHVAQVYCAMRLYASFYGDWNRYSHSYRWQSLDKAARQCNINITQNHRAMGDADLARRLILHVANQPTTKEETHA